MNGLRPQPAVRFGMLTKVLVAVGVFTFALSAEVRVAEAADPIGTVREFSVDGVLSITAGPDGNLWFSGTNGIGRITPEGVITNLGIAGGQITAGPDGNLWFTRSSGIFRMTPDGVITEFAGPSFPASGLRAGPDGNLWFFEWGGHSIGRITPDGVITEFSSGLPDGLWVSNIAGGPDGNMWFGEWGGGTLSRITPAGAVTNFPRICPCVVGQRYPADITTGPDGNLWFTQWSGTHVIDAVVRMTPDGVYTEFATGITTKSYPSGITVGSDGNLWFTEFSGSPGAVGNAVGRVTPDGAITEFPMGISADAGLTHIVSLPSTGTIWYVESYANKIGMRVVSEPVITPPPTVSDPPAPPALPIPARPNFTG